MVVDTQSAQLLEKPGNFVEFREGQGSIREFMEKSVLLSCEVEMLDHSSL